MIDAINRIIKEFELYNIDETTLKKRTKGMETNDLLKSSIQSINYIQAMEALYDIGLLRVLFLKIVLLRRIEESSFGKKEIEKAYKEYCAGCDELVTLKDSIPCDPDLF